MWLAPDAVPPPAPNPPAGPSAPAPAEPPAPTPTPIDEPEPPTLTGEFAQGLEGDDLADDPDAEPTARDGAVATGPFVQETGLAFEFRVESATTFVGRFEDPMSTFTLPGWNAGLFVGYVGTTFVFGLGFDFARTSAKSSTDALEELTITHFLLSPGARAVFARSKDNRTQLLGQLDLGIGGLFFSDGEDAFPGDPEDPSYDHLRVQIAPALRHWITPSFALGTTVGFRYDDVSRVADVGAGFSGEESQSTLGLFGSLQLSAVF